MKTFIWIVIIAIVVGLGGTLNGIDWRKKLKQWKMEMKENDLKKSLIGKWVYLGSPDAGFVFKEDGQVIAFSSNGHRQYHWEVGEKQKDAYIHKDYSDKNFEVSSSWMKVVRVGDRIEVYQVDLNDSISKNYWAYKEASIDFKLVGMLEREGE